MSYPRTDNTSGKTRSAAKPNPGGHNKNVRQPTGTDTSRTRRGTTGNQQPPRGSTPPESTATGRTSQRSGSQPRPVHVESGSKITRISPP